MARTEPDPEGFEALIGDPASHPQASQCRRGERAGVVGRVASVVNVQGVGPRATVEHKCSGHAVDKAAECRSEAPHVNRVGTGTGVHRRRGADRPDVDRVGFGAGVDRGLGAGREDIDRVLAGIRVDLRHAAGGGDIDRVIASIRRQRRHRPDRRALDIQRVVARAEADPESLEALVTDSACHPQASHCRRSEETGVVSRVAGVVDVQGVGTRAAVEHKCPGHAVDDAAERRSEAADAYRVGIGTGIHGRRGDDRPNVNRVGFGAGVDRGLCPGREDVDGVLAGIRVDLRHATGRDDGHRVFARVRIERRDGTSRRARHREGVAPGAEPDPEGFEALVADPASHPQACQRRCGEASGVVGRVTRVVDVQGVGPRATVEHKCSGHSVDNAAERRSEAPHVDRVGPETGVQSRDVSDCGLHIEHVITGAETDLERLHAGIADPGRDAQTGDFRGRERAEVGKRVSGIVDRHGVGTTSPLEREPGPDRVDGAAPPHDRCSDDDRVVTGTGEYRQRRQNRGDVYRVATVTSLERRRGAGVNGIDPDVIRRRSRDQTDPTFEPDDRSVGDRRRRDAGKLHERIGAMGHRSLYDRHRRRRASGVDDETVAAGAGGDRQRSLDTSGLPLKVRHKDRVVAVTNDDIHDLVGRGSDPHGVVTAAEMDVIGLERIRVGMDAPGARAGQA